MRRQAIATPLNTPDPVSAPHGQRQKLGATTAPFGLRTKTPIFSKHDFDIGQAISMLVKRRSGIHWQATHALVQAAKGPRGPFRHLFSENMDQGCQPNVD